MTTLLDVKDVRAGYGRIEVLFDVSLSVDRGSCIAVLGPNGAGKTTLLRTISGFLKPRRGNITFLGEDITRRAPHEIVGLGLGHVMEGRQILGPMTVYDNLLLGAHLRLARERKAEVEKAISYIYQLFPILAERASVAAGSLSGGEQQMLAIGRSLMSNPKLLLLDEPSTGLAPKVVAEILRVLLKLKTDGLTLLLVEQNPDFALRLADRCCVIEGGSVVVEGEAEMLKDHEQMISLYLGGSVTDVAPD